jgi:hypothetical protein
MHRHMAELDQQIGELIAPLYPQIEPLVSMPEEYFVGICPLEPLSARVAYSPYENLANQSISSVTGSRQRSSVMVCGSTIAFASAIGTSKSSWPSAG